MEIKFRGLISKERVWLTGSLLLINDVAYIYPETTGDLDDTDFGYAFEEVITETVGQYTGLKDKNGKEIYEGDIVKEVNLTGVIKWSDGEAKFYILEPGTCVMGLYAFSGEVIGNIHENPEIFTTDI